MSMHTMDVMVVGSGPAGMAAAAACGAQGLNVALISVDPDRSWPATYGAWLDDLADPELALAMRQVWDRVRIRHACTEFVQRRYGLVDGPAWAEILRNRAEGVQFLAGRVGGARHDEDGSTVDVSGTPMRARVVIDASGAQSALLQRRGAPTLFQVAWGETIEADIGPDMRWMEFGDEGTFLYAMPLGDGRAFVEETALVTPGLAFDVLRERLHRRLAAEGIRARALSVERCLIPMDLPIPPVQRVVAFGAAAGMVHPATGFLLPRIVAAAPVLARTLAAHLDEGPDAASRAAWSALWPTARLRQRELHRWGAEVVAQLDPDELRAFFASFFALPDDVRRGWLSDSLPPSGIVAAMLAMFARLPARLKWRVATGSRAVLASLAPRLQEVP